MKIDETHTIFYEKYKPQLVEDLILPEDIKSKIQKFVDNKDIPNIGLFSSTAGTGKSSTANAIAKEMGCEALWINASIERNIDLVREKLLKFASTNSFDDEKKLVIMDESDGITADAQKAFRGFLDEFSGSCRFIFTGNYKEKIISPLLDRLQVYDYNNFDKKSMIKPIFERLKLILDTEGIKYEQADLVPVINTFYPSIRSMVGALQQHSKDNQFVPSDLDNVDVFGSIMAHIKSKNFPELVKAVNDLNAPNNFYTFLYKNIDKYYTDQQYANVIMTLANYQNMSTTVRDLHLNLSACCVNLLKI